MQSCISASSAPDFFGLLEQTLSAARQGRDIPEETRAEIVTMWRDGVRRGNRVVSNGRPVWDAGL